VKRTSVHLILVLLAAVCFTLATWIQPVVVTLGRRGQAESVLKVLLGDGRRLFANHFFVQADVSFHSGYYPSIFDRREPPTSSPMTRGHDEHGEDAHEREMAFLGQPRDWIEQFGRYFRVTEHKHLEGGQEREILPWLRLSAELDPQRVETYTVAAYWLRIRLGRIADAEAFLREGLRNNPDSYQILFELGRLYQENRRDTDRARNVWEQALRRWTEQESKKEQPDIHGLEGIAVNLARLEEAQGNLDRAVGLLELGKKASPHPDDLQKQIDELKQKQSTLPR